jgi:hypothetical protein
MPVSNCSLLADKAKSPKTAQTATQNCDAFRLTPLDSRPYEAQRVHGASGKQRGLIGGYPQKILPRIEPVQGVTAPATTMMAQAW